MSRLTKETAACPTSSSGWPTRSSVESCAAPPGANASGSSLGFAAPDLNLTDAHAVIAPVVAAQELLQLVKLAMRHGRAQHDEDRAALVQLRQQLLRVRRLDVALRRRGSPPRVVVGRRKDAQRLVD